MGHKNSQNFISRCFRDADGHQTFAQMPNLPILVWIAASLTTKVTTGQLNHFLDLLAFGAIFTWAWLEIFQGDSYFRRLLGAIVLVITMWHRV